jgi:hypothetical protein
VLALALLVLVSTGAAAESEQAGAAALRVAVIGDLNGSYGAVGYSPEVRAAVRRIVELDPDLVLGVGDLIAGQQSSPRLDRSHLETMWEAFDREVLAPLTAAGIPFAPVPGNHDASAEPAFELERRVFAEHWRHHQPEVGLVSEAGYPFRYGFVVRDVLFVILDATRVGPLSQGQRDWLEGVLREGEDSRTRIVAGHLPLRAFTHGRESEVLADHALETILRDGGVGLYLSGHHHAFYPGFGGGFLQVSQGCLGAGPRRLLGAGHRAQRSFTMVEVSSAGGISIDGWSAPGFVERIDRSSLPASIRSAGVEILRDDVAAAGPSSGGAHRESFDQLE